MIIAVLFIIFILKKMNFVCFKFLRFKNEHTLNEKEDMVYKRKDFKKDYLNKQS